MIITVTLNPAIDKTAEVSTMVTNGLNRLNNVILDVGGKGINVSKAIKELGGQSICTGFIAGDNGAWIEKKLDELGLEYKFKHVEGNTRMNLKVLDADMNLTELNEVGNEINAEDLQALKSELLKMTFAGDIVVLSGSVPRGVPKDIYKELITLLKEKGAKIILDADGDLFTEGLEAGPNLIKPNKYELCKYFGLSEDVSDLDLIENARKLLYKGIDTIVISLGSKGAIFITHDEVAMVPGLKIIAHSAVGAGDSMVGALAYGMEQNYELIPLIKLSVATSAGAVMTEGTKAPNYAVVEKLMKEVEINFKER